MFKKTLQATALLSTVMMSMGISNPIQSDAATVKQDVNVRNGASTSKKVTGVLEKGEKVKILSESNGWYKVKDSDGEKGWSYGKYIKASDNEKEAAKNKVSGITTERLNFRKGPSTDYNIKSVLDKGEELKILSSKDDWYKVKNSDGEKGWVYAKYVKTSDKEVKWENKKDDKSEYKTNGKLKDNANVRKEASTGTKVINVLKEGEKIKVLSSKDGWYKVQCKNGKKGWVYGSHIDSKVPLEKSTYADDSKKSSKKVSYNVGDESDSSSKSGRKMVVSATAYSGDGITATGTVPKWGTIAVDPSIIPYGTRVYIPRLGKTFIAEDCGGGIKGNRIDIFMNSESECNNWGVRSITIQILD